MNKLKSIKSYENYFINKKGEIFNKNKKLTPTKNKGGYLLINLYKNKKYYTKYIHRLVAETFITNLRSYPQVNHINGIKTDNRVENLEWCTQSENMCHAYKNNLREAFPTWKNKFGQEHCKSIKIIQLGCNKEIIKIWGGVNEAQRELKINNISKVVRGLQKTAGGFMWRYAEEC